MLRKGGRGRGGLLGEGMLEFFYPHETLTIFSPFICHNSLACHLRSVTCVVANPGETWGGPMKEPRKAEQQYSVHNNQKSKSILTRHDVHLMSISGLFSLNPFSFAFAHWLPLHVCSHSCRIWSSNRSIEMAPLHEGASLERTDAPDKYNASSLSFIHLFTPWLFFEGFELFNSLTHFL